MVGIGPGPSFEDNFNITLIYNSKQYPLQEGDIPRREKDLERLSGQGVIFFNAVGKGEYEYGCEGKFRNLTLDVNRHGMPEINGWDARMVVKKIKKRNGNSKPGFLNTLRTIASII